LSCVHEVLRFHQGGYRVECAVCHEWWIAVKMKTITEFEPDYERANAGLKLSDTRSITR